MADQPVCQRHGRPAVASRVTHARTEPKRSSTSVRSTSPRSECGALEPRSLFDDFFSDFFSDTSTGTGERMPVQQRQVERVDVTQFFSDATRELLHERLRRRSSGSSDLDTDHLRTPRSRTTSCGTCSSRSMPTAGDRGAVGGRGRRWASAPMSPHRSRLMRRPPSWLHESRGELGSSHVGPEHVLLALRTPTPRWRCRRAFRRLAHARGPSSAASRAALRRKRRRHPSWTSSAVT